MSKTIYRPFAVALLLGLARPGVAAETAANFLGANSCSSSSCHGGGGAVADQFLVWSLKDFHSQRPVATLATARARQIAAALGLGDATASARCTSCHAPLRSVPENLRGPDFTVADGVSCESCHGPAGSWIRSHTRSDYSRADRTAAGMRDLRNLYVRASTCVACHQNVDPDLLHAGHPELIFELDGQGVAEPEHWRAEKNGNGAQAWLVGQAVALREMSWQMTRIHGVTGLSQRLAETNLLERISAVSWLLHQATAGHQGVQLFAEDFESLQSWADKLARTTAEAPWLDATTQSCLTRLAGLASGFTDEKARSPIQARRAERLVLALDRLVAALPELKTNAPVQSSLNQLFQLAQSRPDFEPPVFAAALEKFSAALADRPAR